MAQTKIIISSTGQVFNLPGARTIAQVVADFAESVPGIGAMDSNLVSNAAGETEITFSPKAGTKGANQTKVTVSSTGQVFNLPGVRTIAQVVADFAESVPGIGAMDSNVVVDAAGDTVITFSPKAGTKGL